MKSFAPVISRPPACLLFMVFGAMLNFAPSARPNPAANLSNTIGEKRAAIIVRDETIRCPLREGETTFIVSSPRNSLLDRVVLVNENMSARGELRIAVSSDKLSVSSNKWIPVDGRIRFRRKRLFNLSLVGVEAKYVKLTFRVEREQAMATLASCSSLSKVATQLIAF
jgi:macrodomain Ter protein organizer (MatP/YcbG family)